MKQVIHLFPRVFFHLYQVNFNLILINFMQPYGPQDWEDMGLFTFYREQAHLQRGVRKDSRAESLNEMLSKVEKIVQNEKRNQVEVKKEQKSEVIDKKRQQIPHARRQLIKLRQIAEQNSSIHHKKRQQLKVRKSVIEGDIGFQPEKQVNQAKINVKTTRQEPHQKRYEDYQTYKQVSKYLSQLDILRAKKKRFNSLQRSSNSRLNETPQQSRDKSVQQVYNHKISHHFRKLALQPHQFNGLTELSKSMIPIAINKKEKTALKSYRKELKALTQIRRDEDIVTPKYIAENLSHIKQEFQNNKLIRVQKLSSKLNQDQPIIQNKNIKSESLPKLKMNIPEVMLKRQHTNITAMSLQLMKSYQLRSRYQIRLIEKQDQALISNNQKIRKEVKQLRNSSQSQFKHYLSLRSSPGSPQKIKRQNQIEFSSQVPQNSSLERLKSHQMSPKKDRQIFCNRDDYLKNYKDKLKKNIVAIEREHQNKIKSMIESKNKEVIANLINRLSFL